MKQRLLATLLSLCLLVGLLPTVALANLETYPINEPLSSTNGSLKMPGVEKEAGESDSAPQNITTVTLTQEDSADSSNNTAIEAAFTRLSIETESITSLKILTEGTAVLSPEDFYYLRDNIENLSYIDIGEAACKDNKIPDIAFCESLGTEENNWNPVGRPALSTVILPQNITEIGKYAFYGSGLTALELPSTLKVIGNNAFGNCANFAGTLRLPDGLVTIDSNAFNKTPIKGDLVIPDTVITVGQNAFMNCGITGTLTIGKSVKTIGNNGFAGNLFTGDLIIPDSVETMNNWVFSDGAFENGKWTLGNGLVFLGDSALKGICSGNEGTLFIPSQLETKDTSLGYNTFSKVVFEEGTTVVSARVVRGSTAITEVVLPSTLTTIGTGAFSECSSLSTVTLPNGVTTINAYAFSDTALPSIFVPASVETIGARVFEALPQNSIIYVENDSVYQQMIEEQSDPWNRRFDSAKTALAVTNGGTFAEGTAFKAGQLATPTKAKYSFQGWYTTENFQETPQTTAVPGQTYYAKWTQSNYEISDSALRFGTVTYGSPVDPRTVTVSNNSESGSGSLTAEISNDAIFTVGVTGNTVSVKPAENLGVGTYNEVITITTPDDATFFVDVSITIEQAPTSIGITAKPTSLTGGGTVTLTVTKTGLPQDAQVSVSGYSNIIDNGDGTYTVILPNTTASYTFTANYEGDVNHEAATADCTVFVTQYTGGGSSSSGGSSSGSSSVSGSGDNVIITASSGTVTDAQMESAVKKANKGSTITIKATSSTTVTLPVGGMADAADNNNDVLLDLRYGEVTLSARAIAGMTDGVSSNDKIKVSVTSQTNSKDETISDLLDKGGAVFDVSVEVDGVEIHSFDGTLTITLTVSNLSKISDPHVLHILTDGTKEYYAPDRISGNTITVKGVRNLSTFAVIPGSEVPQTNPFTDVTTSDYYYDAVLWAVANGVTNGSTVTTFSPNTAVSRAQMVTFLWRAHGSPKATGANPFTDVSTSDYYYDAVLWAVANGVTNGTSATTFSPDMAVTRAQAVTFQWRAAGSPVVSGSSFGDVAADAYYADAVTWAVANGITNGTGGNTFSPDVVVSRAQAVTFLWRELA